MPGQTQWRSYPIWCATRENQQKNFCASYDKVIGLWRTGPFDFRTGSPSRQDIHKLLSTDAKTPAGRPVSSDWEIHSHQDKELVKGLGLTSATMLVMGSMIGSGIFIVSADIARK